MSTLGDSEYGVRWDEQSDKFILDLMPIITDDGFECYITAVGKGNEDYLMCRLDAINGVSIEEIVERMSILTGCSTKQELYYEILGASLPTYCQHLKYFGIMDEGMQAVFTLTNREGKSADVTLEAVPGKSVQGMDKVEYKADEKNSKGELGLDFASSHLQSGSCCEVIADGKVVYVQFNFDYIPDVQGSYDRLMERIKTAAASGKVEKLAIDFRGTYDGSWDYSVQKVIKTLNDIDAKIDKYILIDHTIEAPILTALILRNVEGAKSVGSTVFNMPLLSSRIKNYYTPFEGVWINYFPTSLLFDVWPEREDKAFNPDITVYETAEDYRNGIDSVLKAIVDLGK